MVLASAAIAQPTAPSPPIKPAQSPVVPGKALSAGEAASPLGAIQRSNPVVVPPPQTNSAEQSYSRGSGFVSQHGSSPTQGAPLSSQGPSVHGANSGQNIAKPYGSTPAPTELGKGSRVSPGAAVSPPKVTPSKPPLSQTQTGPRPTGSGDGLQGDGGIDRLSTGRTANSPNPFGSGKDSLTYERRPNPSIQPITPAPSPATQAGQQGKR
jgi:hypothetical protein